MRRGRVAARPRFFTGTAATFTKSVILTKVRTQSTKRRRLQLWFPSFRQDDGVVSEACPVPSVIPAEAGTHILSRGRSIVKLASMGSRLRGNDVWH